MEDKKQLYFGEVGGAPKILAVGTKVTMKEYFTPKSTEQHPENRKTTLCVARRHRGRLVLKRGREKNHKCTACTMYEKACPNDTVKILSEMVADEETGKKKKQLVGYGYGLGGCMFCESCVNAYNFSVVRFTNDFENAVFDHSKLVLHLDKEVYEGGSLPGLIDGDADWKVGTFNTKKK